MATSVYFNKKVLQGSTCFLGKYYSREYLNVKIPHFRLFQGEYLFPGGSTYWLVNMYWGSGYILVNNYWWVIFFRRVIINGYTRDTFSRSISLMVVLHSLFFLHWAINNKLNYLEVIWNMFVNGLFYDIYSDYVSFCLLSYLTMHNLIWIVLKIIQ